MAATTVNIPRLVGARIALRAPRPSDVDDRLRAGRDPEFRRFLGGAMPLPPLTRADAERWYAIVAEEPLGWMIERDSRCIGIARLHSLDWVRRRATFSFGIFSRRDRGCGLGTETARLVLGHAFGALGLALVRLRVLAFNAPALACLHRVGFRETGRIDVEIEGLATSDVEMEITPREFRRAIEAMREPARAVS